MKPDEKILALGALAAALAPLAGCRKQDPPRPNVVFILADDLGWGDLSCYGQKLFDTPNIDALASHGIRFTQCYSGTTVSAPSRSCLLTGTHSGHTAIRGNKEIYPEGQQALPGDIENIFRDFKRFGYTTAAFGKWGLGVVGSTGDPNAQGLDRFFGYNCQRLAHTYYPDHLWDNSRMVLIRENNDDHPYGEGTYSGDLIHEKALEFIDEAAASGKPFFMWYPTTIPHAELIVPKDSIYYKFSGKFPEKPFAGTPQGSPGWRTGGYCPQDEPHATFAAMVTRLDIYVGQIVDKLKKDGLFDNTIIIFASDNGPHREGGADPDFFDSNGPWRGYKRDLYEGGIRVPMIVEWPGHISEGRTTDFMCSFWDVMPTLRGILDNNTDCTGMDGVDLTPLLEGRKKGQKEHEFLYFEFAERDSQASRIGPWKLIHLGIRSGNDRYELYNLDDDPSETTDVAAEHPDIVERLKGVMVREHIPNHDFPLFDGE